MNSTYIEISTSNFIHNLDTIKNYAKKQIIPVIKANAYGHGMVEIAKLCRKSSIELIAVAFVSEAESLRTNGDNEEILVLVENPMENIQQIVDLNLQTVLSDYHFAEKLNSIASQNKRKIKVHIFIDTGMHRDGVNLIESKSIIQKIMSLSNIEIVGLMTHFAASDDDNLAFTLTQIENFKNIYSDFKSIKFKYIHLQNSGGILNCDIEIATHIRPGISIYGITPSEILKNKINLKPILKLQTEIIRIKEIEIGEQAGYSNKFIAKRKSLIAFVPIGYGDGLNTNLTNNWNVEINDKLYPIVGSICMDQILIDITDSKNINIGDKVTIISDKIDSNTSIYRMAEKANVILYDITTKLLPRLKRIYL